MTANNSRKGSSYKRYLRDDTVSVPKATLRSRRCRLVAGSDDTFVDNDNIEDTILRDETIDFPDEDTGTEDINTGASAKGLEVCPAFGTTAIGIKHPFFKTL